MGKQWVRQEVKKDWLQESTETAAAWAFANQHKAGAIALVTLAAIFWTTTLGAIAAVGLYVIRIYKDVRNRPQYIIESTVGLSKASQADHVERAIR